jgi:hypothetical protein
MLSEASSIYRRQLKDIVFLHNKSNANGSLLSIQLDLAIGKQVPRQWWLHGTGIRKNETEQRTVLTDRMEKRLRLWTHYHPPNSRGRWLARFSLRQGTRSPHKNLL